VAAQLLTSSRPFVPHTPELEALVSALLKPIVGRRTDAGLGLMEVIVGVLVALIVGSILLHLGRMGVAMYRLNSTTGGIAQKLQVAREQALSRRASVSVIFNAKEKKFGLDRNGNGRLDSIEEEELPPGVDISEDLVVTFERSGSLVPGTKQTRIIISNSRDSRQVSVSESGTIEID
jgi:hypothetical protein